VAVAYEGLCTFEFGCTTEIFALSRPELDVPWYRFDVCSVDSRYNTLALCEKARDHVP
jgi:AraC family transcriptional activator FtrA